MKRNNLYLAWLSLLMGDEEEHENLEAAADLDAECSLKQTEPEQIDEPRAKK